MTEPQAKMIQAMAENRLNMSRSAQSLHYQRSAVFKCVKRVLAQTGKDMRDFYDMHSLLRQADVFLGTERGTRYAPIMEYGTNTFSDEFGAVLNCAVRYCIGRRTYMPKLVMNVIRPLLPDLSDKTLWVFKKDIEGADDYGMYFDEASWMDFLSDVKSEIDKRGDPNADRK